MTIFFRNKDAHYHYQCASLKKKEKGSFVVDELSCFLVTAFMFAMILAYASYAKMVQMRLAIDNVAKEYLYQMEQEGYLSNEMMLLMKKDLKCIGVKEESVDFSETSHMVANQAAYGDKIVLCCTVSFDNPLYDLLSIQKHSNGEEYNVNSDGTLTNPEGTMFTIGGLNPTITYKVRMSATAKW